MSASLVLEKVISETDMVVKKAVLRLPYHPSSRRASGNVKRSGEVPREIGVPKAAVMAMPVSVDRVAEPYSSDWDVRNLSPDRNMLQMLGCTRHVRRPM